MELYLPPEWIEKEILKEAIKRKKRFDKRYKRFLIIYFLFTYCCVTAYAYSGSYGWAIYHSVFLILCIYWISKQDFVNHKK